MIIAKRLKGKAISAWLGSTGDAARRAARGLRQQWTKEPSRLAFYFDAGDAWSYLTAQAASRLVDAYGVDIDVHPISAPASDVDPQPAMRVKHAVRDAQQLAGYFDVEFAGKKEPDPGALRDVNSALIKPREGREQLAAALELAGAMWANDRKALTKLLGKWGTESSGSIAPILSSAYGDLRKAGHYQGAMLAYGGEWYWGLDRLPYLEEALARDTGKPVAHVISTRPEAERAPEPLSAKPLTCEMWFSFRSPYAYLALMQMEELLAPSGVPLVVRPILPMIRRGMQVPTIKALYIARDAKRVADRLGIPFGELCTPEGTAVENLLTLSLWAERQGQLLPFVKSAATAIWTEARDMAEYVDLRHVTERAGLSWQDAREVLGSPLTPEAMKWAQGAAADLAVVGLWGVPSFRCGDFVAWGQDRLPLLADRLRRHQLAVAAKNPS